VKSYKEEAAASQVRISLGEFLASYNETIPERFPHATKKLLEEFRDSHATYFRKGDSWSLDDHRKRVMDWLTQKGEPTI
jgi:hypothetical protein